MSDQPRGLLVALWLAFLRFVASLFSKSPNPAPLPIPVTARPKVAPTPVSARISTWVNEPTRTTSAASSPLSSTAACRSRSATPKRALADPFPHISLSGIFATSSASPDLRLSLPPTTPGTPPSRGPSSPLHTLHSTSPRTPSTPFVPLDRSTISPTTMSDGSLEVISLGDRPGSPVTLADIPRLPSPWSPTGKIASSDVWMSVDGMLTNATGPVDTPTQSWDDSAASRTAMHTLSRISSASLYSPSSALDVFGISVFANLDHVGGGLSSQSNNVDASIILMSNQPRDENRPTPVTQTPRKRRDTLPFVTPHTPNHSARAAKHLSTPLTKLDNVDAGHVRSATSISSMAYELRMGLFADGRSMTGFENILSLLDQASPESIPPYNDAMRPVAAG